MRRRCLVAALGAAATCPLAVRAQPTASVTHAKLRLGLVELGTMSSSQRAFFDRLAELGFVEGRNLTIDGDMPRFSADPAIVDVAAADMVKGGADILVALGPELVLGSTRRAAAGRIPVVFVAMDYDPVRSGYVSSLAKPGGNVTAVFVRQPELAVKRLEIARDALPKAKRAALWWDGNAAREQFEASSSAAASLGFDLRAIEVGAIRYDFGDAMRRTEQNGAEAIILASSIPYYNGRAGIAQAALERRLPLITFAREFVEMGAMLSYGVNIDSMWRRAADYVARIARGEKASDLPVEQPSRFELVVNARTATALGVTLKPALLARADEVIE